MAEGARELVGKGGGQVAFQPNRDGNFGIYAMGPNGEHQTNLTNHPVADLTPDWQALQER